MYEYIKRTDAIAQINRGDLLVGNCAEWAREIIWRTPYADVVEVKHGHWLDTLSWHYGYKCSECAFYVENKSNFCPCCGARMDGEHLYERISK